MRRMGKGVVRVARGGAFLVALLLPILHVLPLRPVLRPIPVARAQQPAFRSLSAELVVLPVVVTDRHGGYVGDLLRDRFTVFDNGRKVPIELFSNEDTPVTVGLVIDSSSSMRTKMGAVIAAASRFAALSNPQDELFALRFNDDVSETVPDRRFLLASDRVAFESALGTMVPEGRTALYDALLTGLEHLDRGGRPRKVLLLISDGGDNASAATLESVLVRARRSNATIYTIGLFEPDDPDSKPRVLKDLANATGGERFIPRSTGPLLQVCERIAREIRSGYTIGYEPPDHDGVYHHVRVLVDTDGRKLKIRTRPGYFAGGEAASK